MPTGVRERRLATFLFLDVVGSTTVASELGDRRWRDLLHRFRGAVRGRLRANGGKEVDWAGDGLFATFPEPARAIRAAADIVRAVQDLGLEVRCGVHTGEAETVDGKLAGLGVHLAARVMALGGAADVLTSNTVRELVTGAHMEFEDRGTHELKGVPGTWSVLRVTAIDGEPLAPALPAEEAARRVAAVEPPEHRRRRTALLIGAGALAVAVAITGWSVLTGRSDETGAQPEEPDPGPVTLVGMNTTTGESFQTRYGDGYSEHLWGILSIEQGYLWQVTPDAVVRRDLETGENLDTIEIDGGWDTITSGFGWIWIGRRWAPGETEILRVSPLSGNTRSLRVPGDLGDLRAGNRALWFLDRDGVLREIDPIDLDVVAEHDTKTESGAVVVPVAGYVWVCECDLGRVVQFDPRTDEIVRELTLPQQGFMLPVSSTSPTGEQVWLLDPQASTLTPIDPVTGEDGRPIGVRGILTDATIDGSLMWVATQTAVYRVNLITLEQERFPVPSGVSAGSVAPTPDGSAFWVANCGCPIEE